MKAFSLEKYLVAILYYYNMMFSNIVQLPQIALHQGREEESFRTHAESLIHPSVTHWSV